MKNILLFIMFLMPFFLYAQEDAFGPQKNDNLIIVTTDTIDKTALEKAAKAITEQGFKIKEKNPAKGTLTTDFYDFKKGAMTLIVITQSNEIRIYGYFEPNFSITSGADNPKSLKKRIDYQGVAGSPSKEAWNTMDAFANQLTQSLQGTISYMKWGE